MAGTLGKVVPFNQIKLHSCLAKHSYKSLTSNALLDQLVLRRMYSSYRKPDTSHIPELQEPPFKQYYDTYFQAEKGRVHDKKPFKVMCQKGKIYYWCSCGHSHNQPFCDGAHRIPAMKITMKPIPFKPQETREYWFCNCKQTNNRPFCDGTHKTDNVQNAQTPFCDGAHRIPAMKITMKPIPFKPQETREYWFCNCKQTNNRPFCDGTHKTDNVQNAQTVIKYYVEKKKEDSK